MINYFVRIAKRILVLLPGIIGTYFAIGEIYPFVDNRVPWGLALFVTYVLTAYVLIPALIRLYRIFVRVKHIPTYCTTPDGYASDPINIGIIATRKELISSMTAAGWHQSDPRSLKNMLRLGLSILFNQHYATAPFSTLYLFGRRQDIGFQRRAGDNPHHRHHVRFWATTFAEGIDHKAHLFFWQKLRGESAPHRVMWVGAASLDEGFGIIRHNAQITHMIDPDTDSERDLIVQQLKKTNFVKRVRVERIDSPYRLINRVWRGHLKADGRIKIIEFKHKNPSKE